MQTHNLVQGSPEWDEHRKKYDNASDLPAAAGKSKYKSRNELMNEYKTGITKDINSSLQAIFDKGHRFESLARPLAEKLIGKDIYPVIGTDGSLGASFDGLTMMDDINWEHKTLNDAIRACETADDLDEMYKLQMDQQMFISGAEKTLFSATQWDEYDTLIEEKHLWYTTTPERLQMVVDIWAQFHIDLETFETSVVIDKPKANAIMALPSLAIAIKGEVTASNLIEFKDAATVFISNIKTELITDQDFVDADKMVGFLDGAEKNIEAAKTAAISQTASIDELMRTMDFIKAQLRDKRLMLEKLVKSEKEVRKLAVVNEARAEFTKHIDSHLPTRLQFTIPDFSLATKNKKTISSMKESVNQMLVNAKIEIDNVARDINRKKSWFDDIAKDYENLFPDFEVIKYKANEDFQLLVNSRIKEHKQKELERDLKNKEDDEALANSRLADAQIADQAANKPNLASNTLPPKLEPTFAKIFAVETNKKEMPSINSIIQTIASAYQVSEELAYEWLVASFSNEKEAA